MSGGRIAVSLLVSLLLARLLGPEAFGVLAMANVYIFLVDMLVRQGMPAALIQRPDLDRRHLDTAFWMILGVIGVMIPASIALSGWWARVNAVPELQGVIIWLTPVLALRGLAIVQESQLRRHLEFRALALRTNLAVLIGGITGIALALAGMGVWALVVQQITLALVEMVVLWTVSDWRPRWCIDIERGRELLGFSGLSSVAGIGVFLQDKVDALLIGLIFGPVAVGLYRMATRLTAEAVKAVAGALQSVSLPELSRFALDTPGLNRRTRELVHLSTLMAVPALGIMAMIAEPLLGALGDEWLPATIALQILCVAAAFQVPAALTGPLLQAAGRPGLFAGVTWLAALASGASFVTAGLLLKGAPVAAQLTGLAASRLGSMVLVITLVVLPLLSRALGLRPRAMAGAVLPVTLTVGVAVVGGLWLLRTTGWSADGSPLARVVVTGAFAVALITLSTLAVDPLARRLARRAWRRLGRGGRPNRSRGGTQGSGASTATTPAMVDGPRDAISPKAPAHVSGGS